jgi:hypothetical protein
LQEEKEVECWNYWTGISPSVFAVLSSCRLGTQEPTQSTGPPKLNHALHCGEIDGVCLRLAAR